MKLILFAIVTFLYISLQTQAQEIINHGFETSEYKTKNNLLSWEIDSSDSTFFIDSTIKFSGKKSLCVKSNTFKSVQFKQKIKYRSKELQKYRLTARVKLDSNENKASISVHTYDRKNNKGRFRIITKEKTLINDWQTYSCEFYLDQTIEVFEITATYTGVGKAWFDEFELEIINNTSTYTKEAYDYFIEAWSIIEKNSIMGDSIDMQEIKNICLDNMNGLQTKESCYTLISYAIAKLGDNHSFLKSPNQEKAYSQNTLIEQATGKIINKEYAYINIPKVTSSDSITLSSFATKLQNMIRTFDNELPTGWIVDLRNNLGGNCWPMIAGVGPLIGEGACCYLIEKDTTFTFSYRDGISFFDDYPICQISNESYKIKRDVPIAVLIGPKTASGGEITAISFIGKNMCKLFGEPSYGISTGNATFPLSDGAAIILTTGIDADRNFKRYGGKIQPDYPVKFTSLSFSEENDPVIQAAVNWIKLNN